MLDSLFLIRIFTARYKIKIEKKQKVASLDTQMEEMSSGGDPDS